MNGVSRGKKVGDLVVSPIDEVEILGQSGLGTSLKS